MLNTRITLAFVLVNGEQHNSSPHRASSTAHGDEANAERRTDNAGRAVPWLVRRESMLCVAYRCGSQAWQWLASVVSARQRMRCSRMTMDAQRCVGKGHDDGRGISLRFVDGAMIGAGEA